MISLLYSPTCFEHATATCRWPSRAQVEAVLSQPVHRAATYSVMIPDAVIST